MVQLASILLIAYKYCATVLSHASHAVTQCCGTPVASTPKMTLHTVFWHTGIKFLVDMRADVRKAVKTSPATAGPLRALDRSLRYAAMAHDCHSLHHYH